MRRKCGHFHDFGQCVGSSVYPRAVKRRLENEDICTMLGTALDRLHTRGPSKHASKMCISARFSALLWIVCIPEGRQNACRKCGHLHDFGQCFGSSVYPRAVKTRVENADICTILGTALDRLYTRGPSKHASKMRISARFWTLLWIVCIPEGRQNPFKIMVLARVLTFVTNRRKVWFLARVLK